MPARYGLGSPNEADKLIRHQFGDFSPHAHSLLQRVCERSTPRTDPRKGDNRIYIRQRNETYRWERIFKPEEGRDSKFICKNEFYIKSWK